MVSPAGSKQVAELVGRLDALQGEITQASRELEQFTSRDAQADLDRLLLRKKQLESELQRLKKYW